MPLDLPRARGGDRVLHTASDRLGTVTAVDPALTHARVRLDPDEVPSPATPKPADSIVVAQDELILVPREIVEQLGRIVRRGGREAAETGC